MKKNGFTLVELLSVIIILSILVTIVVVAVNPTIEKSKNKLSKIQIEYIENAANSYYLKEGVNNEYNDDSFEMCVDLSYLIENDYIENEEILNPKDYEKLNGSVKITYKFDQFTYKYKENNCTYKYQSLDNICTLVNDAEPQGISIGDKYQCKVKDEMEEGFEDGYYFYVLSSDDNETVNLIMDRNMYYDEDNDVGKVATEVNKGLVAWYAASETNEFGPVTAMDNLYNATKDWSNVPNIMINYIDEEDVYGTIITTNNVTKITKKDGSSVIVLTNKEGYTNLKARMPKYREVSYYDKTNGYLFNNLHRNCYDNEDSMQPIECSKAGYIEGVFEEGIEDINGIYGYWTLSSRWYVDFFDYVYDEVSMSLDDYNGVRPVITIPKNELGIKVPM